MISRIFCHQSKWLINPNFSTLISQISKKRFEQTELQAKLLNYFLGSNKSNINQASVLLQDLYHALIRFLISLFQPRRDRLHNSEQIELQAKLLNYFLGSNKSNINQKIITSVTVVRYFHVLSYNLWQCNTRKYMYCPETHVVSTVWIPTSWTMVVCCLAGLAILVSKAIVFLSCIGYVGWVWWLSICDVLWYSLVSRQCRGGVSSVLAFRREALPTLRYFPKDTELALDMTLLELLWIRKVLYARQEDGRGMNRWS